MPVQSGWLHFGNLTRIVCHELFRMPRRFQMLAADSGCVLKDSSVALHVRLSHRPGEPLTPLSRAGSSDVAACAASLCSTGASTVASQRTQAHARSEGCCAPLVSSACSQVFPPSAEISTRTIFRPPPVARQDAPQLTNTVPVKVLREKVHTCPGVAFQIQSPSGVCIRTDCVAVGRLQQRGLHRKLLNWRVRGKVVRLLRKVGREGTIREPRLPLRLDRLRGSD